jgi:hypothetical protein
MMGDPYVIFIDTIYLQMRSHRPADIDTRYTYVCIIRSRSLSFMIFLDADVLKLTALAYII